MNSAAEEGEGSGGEGASDRGEGGGVDNSSITRVPGRRSFARGDKGEPTLATFSFLFFGVRCMIGPVGLRLVLRSRSALSARPTTLPVLLGPSTTRLLPATRLDRLRTIMDHAAPAAAQAPAAPAPPTKKKLEVTSHNQYDTPRLLRDSIHPDPLEQFNVWLSSALNPRDDGQPAVHEPEAMTVSTCVMRRVPEHDGHPIAIPSSRVVLLKQVDDRGFIFYTNYNSRKSRELLENPYASCAFYWRETSRSVRVSGRVEKVSRQESEAYFASRPRGSQVGAWASAQSDEVGEDELEDKVREVEKRFEGKDVPCPPHWGGWRIVPL